jgi:hypothetical protein
LLLGTVVGVGRTVGAGVGVGVGTGVGDADGPADGDGLGDAEELGDDGGWAVGLAAGLEEAAARSAGSGLAICTLKPPRTTRKPNEAASAAARTSADPTTTAEIGWRTAFGGGTPARRTPRR